MSGNHDSVGGNVDYDEIWVLSGFQLEKFLEKLRMLSTTPIGRTEVMLNFKKVQDREAELLKYIQEKRFDQRIQLSKLIEPMEELARIWTWYRDCPVKGE